MEYLVSFRDFYLCLQDNLFRNTYIVGAVLNAGFETRIATGHINRVNNTWNFQAVSPASSIFEAVLDNNGNMTNGTILQPNGATYVFYAKYLSN